MNPELFLAPTFDSAGMQNVIDSLSNSEHYWKDAPLVLILDGNLPVCWEEGSSEESVIADTIPLNNILWAGSKETLKGIDFRTGWEKFFHPDLKNEEPAKIAQNTINYFKNLGFTEVTIK